MTAPDVVVVGAGIMGASLCYELARAGCRVTLVDAGQACGGSSGRNAGGIRQQFSHPLNVALATDTVARMVAFGEQFGVDIGLHQAGYLFLVADPARAAAMREAVARQNRLGVPTEWLSPQEVAELVPGIAVEDLVGGAYCATDGYLDPNAVVGGYVAAARAGGADVRQFCAVVGVGVSGDRVAAVQLADGTRLPCGVLVNCAGAWAGEVAALYGASLPITPWRSHCFHVTGVALPGGCPMTIDYDHDKAYFHPEGDEVLAGMDNVAPAPAGFDIPVDWAAAEPLVERLIARMPAFADAGLAGGWAGLLEVTPDENPIVGWTHLANCYTAAGFSGHGLSLAPALAADVAAEVRGSPARHDLTPFRLERFAASAPPTPEVLAMR